MLKKKLAVVLSLSCVVSMCGPLMSSNAAQWKQDDSGWKYERDNGTFSTGGWEQIAEEWYYLNEDGYMQTGWLQVNGDWYYLDSSGAMLRNESRNIDGVDYHFGSDGRMESETTVSKEQAEQWFYASYAIIANETEWNTEYFRSSFGQYENEAKTRLEMAWGIEDQSSAHAMVNELINGLHRISYQETMELFEQYGYMSLSQADLSAVFPEGSVTYDMIQAYKTSGAGAIDAWDYCRAMQVLRESYLAGYYTEQEELDKMLEVAKILQNRFGSWDEMTESYLRGYEYWKGKASAYESRKAGYEKLKTQTSYYQIDWNMNLGKKW